MLADDGWGTDEQDFRIIDPPASKVVRPNTQVRFECSDVASDRAQRVKWTFTNGDPATSTETVANVTYGGAATGKMNEVLVEYFNGDELAASATTKIWVPTVSFGTVEGADDLGSSVYATASSSVNVKLKLSPPDCPIAQDWVTWEGGVSTDALSCKVSSGLNSAGVLVKAMTEGTVVAQVRVAFLPGKPGLTQPQINFSSIRNDYIFFQDPEAPLDPFGLTSFKSAIRPQTQYLIYYESAQWRYILKSATATIQYGVRNLGRTNIDGQIGNPLPGWTDMPPGTSEVDKRSQARRDLSPGASGNPPRSKYYSEALVEAHEQFHVADALPYLKRGVEKGAARIAGAYSPVTPSNLDSEAQLAGTKFNLDYIVRTEIEKEMNRYAPECEMRAYESTRAAYQALVNQINSLR